MAVRSAAKGDENGGAASGGDFCRRNCTGPANNHVSPCKALGHVRQERHDFRQAFSACIRGAHCVIVTFAGLMDDVQLIFSRCEQVHGIHKNAVNRQSTLAAASDEESYWLHWLTRGSGKKLWTHGTACNNGFFSPSPCRNFIASGDSLRNPRHQFVRKTRLCVRFKNDVGHTAKPRGQQHRPCGIAANTKRGRWLVFPQDPSCV